MFIRMLFKQVNLKTASVSNNEALITYIMHIYSKPGVGLGWGDAQGTWLKESLTLRVVSMPTLLLWTSESESLLKFFYHGASFPST